MIFCKDFAVFEEKLRFLKNFKISKMCSRKRQSNDQGKLSKHHKMHVNLRRHEALTNMKKLIKVFWLSRIHIKRYHRRIFIVLNVFLIKRLIEYPNGIFVTIYV